jgi:hypothetical protein
MKTSYCFDFSSRSWKDERDWQLSKYLLTPVRRCDICCACAVNGARSRQATSGVVDVSEPGY